MTPVATLAAKAPVLQCKEAAAVEALRARPDNAAARLRRLPAPELQ
jgi:hypothetical protein